MATLLALDTSTERLCVALRWGGGELCIEEPGGAQASARIVPAAQELAARAGVRLADLDAVAFGRGPGAFTGLRTACAVAQGLAFGAGCGVLPVDSLLVVAEQARTAHGAHALWVVMDARMDQVYAGAYAWNGEHWETAAAAGLYDVDALNARWAAQPPPAALAGTALAVFGDRLQAGAAPRLDLPHDGRSLALVRLAQRAWDDGAAVDAAQALPVYLRDKVALTTAERHALAAAS